MPFPPFFLTESTVVIPGRTTYACGSGYTTPVGYYRLGSSAPRTRSRGYQMRTRRRLIAALVTDETTVTVPEMMAAMTTEYPDQIARLPTQMIPY